MTEFITLRLGQTCCSSKHEQKGSIQKSKRPVKTFSDRTIFGVMLNLTRSTVRFINIACQVTHSVPMLERVVLKL